MSTSASFEFSLDPGLRDDFVAEAEAADESADALLRTYMRSFVEQRRAARSHDAWFRREVQNGLDEADDPHVVRRSHEDVMAEWHEERRALLKRIGDD